MNASGGGPQGATTLLHFLKRLAAPSGASPASTTSSSQKKATFLSFVGVCSLACLSLSKCCPPMIRAISVEPKRKHLRCQPRECIEHARKTIRPSRRLVLYFLPISLSPFLSSSPPDAVFSLNRCRLAPVSFWAIKIALCSV